MEEITELNFVERLQLSQQEFYERGREMGLLEAKGVVLEDRTSGMAGFQVELAKKIDSLRHVKTPAPNQ